MVEFALESWPNVRGVSLCNRKVLRGWDFHYRRRGHHGVQKGDHIAGTHCIEALKFLFPDIPLHPMAYMIFRRCSERRRMKLHEELWHVRCIHFRFSVLLALF